MSDGCLVGVLPEPRCNVFAAAAELRRESRYSRLQEKVAAALGRFHRQRQWRQICSQVKYERGCRIGISRLFALLVCIPSAILPFCCVFLSVSDYLSCSVGLLIILPPAFLYSCNLFFLQFYNRSFMFLNSCFDILFRCAIAPL